MKSLTQFLKEGLVTYHKVILDNISNEYVKKFIDLKKSVGIRHENQLPTEKQFEDMINKIIKENDKEFAQAFLQLFTAEYGYKDKKQYTDISPDTIYHVKTIIKHLDDKQLKKFDSLVVQPILKRYNLSSIKEFPDYKPAAIKLCKCFNIDLITKTSYDYTDFLK